MKAPRPANENSRQSGSRWAWWLAGGCLLILLIALLRPAPDGHSSASVLSPNAADSGANLDSSNAEIANSSRRHSSSTSTATPEEVVARRLTQFAKSRRDLVHAMAKHFKVEVPDDVERFFEAVEGGRWEEIDA